LGKKRFATSPYRMREPLLLDARHSFIDITAPNAPTRTCLGGADRSETALGLRLPGPLVRGPGQILVCQTPRRDRWEQGLRERSGVDDTDRAVVQCCNTEVEEVGPQRGDVAAHRAVLDRQRPGSVVEEAAACRPGGVAGQGAFLHRGRAEGVDGAACRPGGVAGEGAATDVQRPEAMEEQDPGSVVVDGAARVAGGGGPEGAVADCQRPSKRVIDGTALAGRVIAGEGAAADRQLLVFVEHASTEDGGVARDAALLDCGRLAAVPDGAATGSETGTGGSIAGE